MGLVKTDSFYKCNDVNFRKITADSGSPNYLTSGGTYGYRVQCSLQGSTGWHNVYYQTQSVYPTVFFGARITNGWVMSTGNFKPFLQVASNVTNTPGLSFCVGDSGQILVYYALNSGTSSVTSTFLAASEGGKFNPGTTKCIQVKCVASVSSGSFEVKIDDEVLTWASGSNTSVQTALSTNLYNMFIAGGKYGRNFGGSNTTASSFSGLNGFYYDSVAIWDTTGVSFNDFQVPFSIKPDDPQGNGANSGWLGSDGNSTDNYALLNTATTTNNLTATAANTTDNYTHASGLTSENGIIAVVPTFKASKSDAGSCQISPLIYDGSSNYAMSDVSPQTTEGFVQSFNYVDPKTGVQFNYADYNGYQIGMNLSV